MIDTFTLKFNEAELEIISSALADYRDYAEGETDPILARCNSIDDKISIAFGHTLYSVSYTHLTLPTTRCV